MTRRIFSILFVSALLYASDVYVHFSLEDAPPIDSLSTFFSLERTGRDSAVIILPDSSRLKEIYFTHNMSIPLLSASYPMAYTIGDLLNWDAFPVYSVYRNFLYSLKNSCPEICSLDSICTTDGGHQIYILKISGNVETDEAEPEIFYSGQIHGDELAGSMLLLRLSYYLCTEQDAVMDILNNFEVFIAPMLNPDGCYRPGDQDISSASRFNLRGIDLNRNFPDPGGVASPVLSEKETIAVDNFVKNRDFVLSFNIHGGAEVVNYPWDHKVSRHPLDAWFRYVSRNYADTVHYYSGTSYLHPDFLLAEDGIINGYDWYRTNGGIQDYLNAFHHCRDITLELSNIKMPPVQYFKQYWDYNRAALLNHIRESRRGLKITILDISNGKKTAASILDPDSGYLIASTDCPDSTAFLPALPDSIRLLIRSEGYNDLLTVQAVFGDSLKEIVLKLYPDDWTGITKNSGDVTDIPVSIISITPNPSNSGVVLHCMVHVPGNYRLSVFNILGQKVIESDLGWKNAGKFTYYPNISSNISVSGLYFFEISSRTYSARKKFILMK